MTGESNSTIDLGDKDILAKTRQIRGANDSITLKYVLPSGRVVTSEAFRQDQGAKALTIWCDVIRGQMEADAQDERDKIRRAWQERKAAEKRASSGLVDPSGNALAPAQSASAPSLPMPTAGVFAGSAQTQVHPDDFIRTQVTAAREALERIEWQTQELMSALANARANVQKWEALALSLTPPSPPSQGTLVVPTARRRGRPKKEKLDVGTAAANPSNVNG